MGDGDGVNLVECCVRLGQRLLDDGGDRLDMMAGGDLRHDAAILGVALDLRCHHGGSNVGAILEQRRGGLVAGALDPEDERHQPDALRKAASESPNGGSATPRSVTIALM